MAANGKTAAGLGRRIAFGALAALGWVLVIVVAAGPRPGDRTWIGLPALDDLMGVVFVALIVWAVVWTVRVVRVGGGKEKSRPAQLITLWLGLAIAIAVLLVNPAIVERFLEIELDEPQASEVGEQVEEEPRAPVDFEVTANQVYVVLAAVGAWLAAMAIGRRRGRSGDLTSTADDVIDGDDLSRTIERMVDDLEHGSDPRAAVMAAYHRLERALSDRDRARRPTETPSEHLKRVLTQLPIDHEPFLDLAGRYELARFSDHPITEADRDRAAADLVRARDHMSRLDHR